MIHEEDVVSEPVLGFKGEYAFLSNMFPCTVEVEGITYMSSEAAYMARKTTIVGVRELISTMTGYKAKKFARTIELRPGWNDMRGDEMFRCVVAKFTQNPELALKLMATKDKYLEETNHWNDTFWGVCRGRGSNNLGIILMKVRQMLLDGELTVGGVDESKINT